MESRFFELAHDMLLITSNGRCRHVNAAWTRVLGWAVDELEGRSFVEFVHPGDVDRATDFLHCTGAGVGASQPELRVRMRTRDGSFRVIDWRCAFDATSDVLHAAGRDVSDEARMQAEIIDREAVLRNLVAHQSQARETEHNRISNELHDSAVQHCVAALMFLDEVVHDADESQLPSGSRVTEQVSACLAAIRRVMSGLDADDDMHFPLDARLRSIAEEVARQFHAAITINIDVSEEPAGDLANVACRVAREGLVNACKHAVPGPVSLAAEQRDGALQVRIADAGAGAAPTRSGLGTGRGLLILDARVSAHGGNLRLELGESGSSLIANLPLSPPAASSSSTPHGGYYSEPAVAMPMYGASHG